MGNVFVVNKKSKQSFVLRLWSEIHGNLLTAGYNTKELKATASAILFTSKPLSAFIYWIS